MPAKTEKSLNVHQRILAVIEESGALEKTGTAPSVIGGFSFHAIDDIVGHLRGLLVKHGIIIYVSTVEELRSEWVKTRSGESQLLTVSASIWVVNADDRTDYFVCTTIGQGMDPSDKASGKATSYALKTALLALFQLRGQPDVESEHHEVESRRDAEKPPETTTELRPVSDEELEAVTELLDKDANILSKDARVFFRNVILQPASYSGPLVAQAIDKAKRQIQETI